MKRDAAQSVFVFRHASTSCHGLMKPLHTHAMGVELANWLVASRRISKSLNELTPHGKPPHHEGTREDGKRVPLHDAGDDARGGGRIADCE